MALKSDEVRKWQKSIVSIQTSYQRFSALESKGSCTGLCSLQRECWWRLSLDETCLSQGELYTILTNKAGKGKQDSLVAMMKGTSSEIILHYLSKLLRNKRLKVKEITINLSPSMKLIAQKAFPNAMIVSDRFHVQKLMNEAISDLRVDYRWQAIDQENAEIELAKEMGRKYIPHTFSNGDTRPQLLARSRHS